MHPPYIRHLRCSGFLWLRTSEKQIRVIKLDLWRDTAREPVLHPLNAAVFVVAKTLGKLCGAAQLFNQFFVIRHEVFQWKGSRAVIKHHVYAEVKQLV